MGHIDGTDSMAVAFMNSAGVRQMIGYTVLTWYGYAGWGCLDYFVEQPGRYTFNEAFFANEQALLHRLNTHFPELAKLEPAPGRTSRVAGPLSAAAQKAGLTQQDGMGLLHDRDVLAFYGDPAWEARLAPGKLAYEQTLTEKDGVFTFTIKPLQGEKSFAPVDTNGSQRGGRPFMQLLPVRVKNIQILEGEDFAPVITDNFVLVPNPQVCDPQRVYRVEFKAERVD
jgi:zinc protease